MDSKNSEETFKAVHDKYSEIARKSDNHNADSGVAAAFGYAPEELQSVSGATLSLGCGAPVAQAKLKDGETVVDLGSGGGLDIFLAAKAVGPTGKAVGVDMSHDMISLADRNKEKMNATNAEFVYSRLPEIALPDNHADCIVSNCVINLIPHSEKFKVFNEIYRVLKPGGRIAISDVLARKQLPEDVRKDVALYVGCVAGASQVAEYEGWLKEAGFTDVVIVDAKHDLNAFANYDLNTTGESCVTASCCGSDERCCCSTKEEPEYPCGPTNPGSKCCGTTFDNAPENETAKDRVELETPKGPYSCCSSGLPKEQGVKSISTSSIISDLNEWVGSFMVFSVKPSQ